MLRVCVSALQSPRACMAWRAWHGVHDMTGMAQVACNWLECLDQFVVRTVEVDGERVQYSYEHPVAGQDSFPCPSSSREMSCQSGSRWPKPLLT